MCWSLNFALDKSGFQLSVESSLFCLIRVAFGFSLLIFCDWLKKLAPFSQPIRSKTKTNCVFVAHVFPRFVPFTCVCFDFDWFLLFFVFICDWPE